MKVSQLKAAVDSRDNHYKTQKALATLKPRTRIELDEDRVIQGDSPDLGWKTHEGTLDYLCTVPSQPGLQNILETSRYSIDFEFQLDVSRSRKEFRSKHSRLGFDPAGATLYIGRVRNEELFLVMVPEAFFNSESELEQPDYSTGDSRMEYQTYLRTLVMLSHLCERHAISDITLPYESRYAPRLSTKADLQKVSNIL